MDKQDVVHIYNGILLNHKKEWNNAICSNMNEYRDYHTKSVQDKYFTVKKKYDYHLYVEFKNNGTNKLTYKTEIELQM